jgi:hypothetical protein
LQSTITLLSSTPARSVLSRQALPSWPPKYIWESVQRGVNWSRLTGGLLIENATVDACGVGVISPAVMGTTVSMFLIGGSWPEIPVVTIKVVLSNGERLERSIVQPTMSGLPGDYIEVAGIILPPPASIDTNGLPIQFPGYVLPTPGESQ